MKQRRIAPGPGQESVWDYPRPPRIEACSQRIRVVFNGVTITDTTRSWRMLETSHPPTYYIPPQDVRMEYLHPEAGGSTWCEWKGAASSYTLVVEGRRAERAAWAYLNPSATFADMAGAIAFYASKVDACYVGEEQVQAQVGDYYGGWVTSAIVGPFKGGPGTWGW